MSMSNSPASPAEARRRRILSELDPAHASADPALLSLVTLASQLCGCQAAMLSLVEQEQVRHWVRHGIDCATTARDEALCELVVEGVQAVEIPDLMHDARLFVRRLAQPPINLRFYAGTPVYIEDSCVGALCVLDLQPRRLSPLQHEQLAALAAAASGLLTTRLAAQSSRAQVERERRTRRELLSRTSHELRTPLNAILGFSQLMQADAEHPLAATQAERLRHVRQAGSNLLEAFTELLHMARGGVQLRALDIDPQPVAATPPAAPAQAQPRPEEVVRVKAFQAAAGSVRPYLVLYVEDEPLNVLLMEEVFRNRPDWRLVIARDGQEGLELAAELRPDLLVIDMNLPDFNGIEVLRRLRLTWAEASQRCVVLSADAMPDQINAALAAGFRAYWTKPVHLPELVQAIAQMLDAGAAEASKP
jgi:CheY-like chemotaxis protein